MLMFYTTALLKPQFLIGSWSLATLNIKKKTLLRFKPTLFIGRRIFFWSHRDDDSDLRIKIITIFLCESKCGSNTHIWVRRSLWYVAYSLKEAELNTIFTVSINENAKINTESCPERRAVIFARCVTANALKAWEHFRWEMDVDSVIIGHGEHVPPFDTFANTNAQKVQEGCCGMNEYKIQPLNTFVFQHVFTKLIGL